MHETDRSRLSVSGEKVATNPDANRGPATRAPEGEQRCLGYSRQDAVRSLAMLLSAVIEALTSVRLK